MVVAVDGGIDFRGVLLYWRLLRFVGWDKGVFDLID